MSQRNNLTGILAQHQKEMVGLAILNEFLCVGETLLHVGDVEGAVQAAQEARDRFNRYGIDIRSFLAEHEGAS